MQFNFELHYGAIKRRIIAARFIEGDVAEFEKQSDIHKPKNFSLMKKLARKLCGEFTFVRVDFKVIDDEIYFDTLEFTPAAGMIILADAVDKNFGELLSLNNTLPCCRRIIPQIMSSCQKYSPKLIFAHKERITFRRLNLAPVA